jgi:2-C-methyl-D-erythritol 4-phosphate cytidylyltransferase
LHVEAFKSGKHHYTDDISLYLESSTKKIGIVDGDPQNIKITYKNNLL